MMLVLVGIMAVIALVLWIPGCFPSQEWGGNRTRTVTFIGTITIPQELPQRLTFKLQTLVPGYPNKPVVMTTHHHQGKTSITYTHEGVNAITYGITGSGPEIRHTGSVETDRINERMGELIEMELGKLKPELTPSQE